MFKKIRNLRLLFKYLNDPEMPVWGKIFFFLPLLYFIMPIDVLPDILFPFGYIEDVGILFVGLQMVIKELEKYRLRLEARKNEAKTKKKDNVVHLNPDDYRVK